jgi:hypothetical protein
LSALPDPSPTGRAGIFLEKRAMPEPTAKAILNLAYAIWQNSGCPEGREDEFYHQAEQQLRDADQSLPLQTEDMP